MLTTAAATTNCCLAAVLAKWLNLHDVCIPTGAAYTAAELAPATGTYVGCMFGDYMNLLRVAFQKKHTGPVMTGAALQFAPAVVCKLCSDTTNE